MLIPLPPHIWAFQYLNHEGISARRMVVVESLAFLATEHDYYPLAWVLNALCLDRQARRTFALHKILGQVTEVITPDYRNPATREGDLPSENELIGLVGPHNPEARFGGVPLRQIREGLELTEANKAAEDDRDFIDAASKGWTEDQS